MRATANQLPSINDITNGHAVFRDDMPIWYGTFGSNFWPFTDPSSPMYNGKSTSSFVWTDYINGCGSTFGHFSSYAKSKYDYCLTEEIVKDLKVAAVIHGHYPKLLKHARSTKSGVDPKTVKGRIGELVKFFSLVLNYHHETYGFQLSRLDEISFDLLKECISRYSGRSAHLQRALKLISDPMVQKNLSAPLKWQILDLSSKSIKWKPLNDNGGIPTLSDAQFLLLISHCRRTIRDFKTAIGLELHDKDDATNVNKLSDNYNQALNAYYEYAAANKKPITRVFTKQFGLCPGDVSDLLIDAHASAIMAILLLTGMRDSETKFLMRDCLTNDHGFWFLKSKVVKSRPVDTPVSEGWLAVELTRDAYDILQFVCNKTGNPYLFSSPIMAYSSKRLRGYCSGALNTKYLRWIKKIDTEKLFHDWSFSVHQCRETLVYQLARQEVGMPFISMQLKHFHSQFNRMPNAVTAGYGQYRSQLLAGIAKRKAEAREHALLEVYGENTAFAGGGADAHKARIDTFFSGIGLFGKNREEYIRKMASRGVKLMPTSIGNCTKNFTLTKKSESPPPCYGDYQCDPDCQSHVITKSCATALKMRKKHATNEALKETNIDYKKLWIGLSDRLDRHISKLNLDQIRGV